MFYLDFEAEQDQVFILQLHHLFNYSNNQHVIELEGPSIQFLIYS